MDISVTVCLCVFCLLVCMVTEFSTRDKASGVKFCTAIHQRPIFVNFAPPEALNQNESGSMPAMPIGM